MNRTIRNLIVAAPLATLALTMTPGTAMAFGPQPPIGIPTPDPHPGPKDKAPKPQPQKPKGPGDLAIPKPKPVQPAPKPQPNGGNGGNGGQQGTASDAVDTDSKKSEVESTITASDVCLTQADECHVAPVAEITAAPAQNDEDGMELAWLLAGGAVVTASGVAFVARKRSQRNA